MQAVSLRILRPVSAGAAGSFAPGQVVRVSAETAASLVSVGKAQYATETKVEDKPAPEVAAVAPVIETADAAPAATIRRKAAKK